MRGLLLLTLVALPAFANDAERFAKYFEVKTTGSTSRLKSGDTGKLVIAITAKNGAHINDEAPVKIQLSSGQSKLSKDTLTLADSQSKEAPRFEVEFTPAVEGSTSVEAKLTFFVCAEQQCSRQTQSLTFPVEVM